MVIPKNRIRLSRALRSQTSPYPNANRILKNALFLVIGLIVIGVYFFSNQKQEPGKSDMPKQILGDQEKAVPLVKFDTYRIKNGDTLFNLGQKLDISWHTLAEINNLSEPYVLKIGQSINIPSTAEKPTN